jgi:hypothetical protein
VDRTVPPVIPVGEAEDGVVDAADRASRALSKTKASPSRVNQASRAHRPNPARISMGVSLKAPARTVAIADQLDPIARSSAARARGR